MPNEIGTVTREQVRHRLGWSYVYTITLPGHYETDALGALVLVDGGTHKASGKGMDWVRTTARKYGIGIRTDW